MGKIELDHTGSGGGVTLSSDGTDLLLDGTAVGGSALELYAENPSSPTAPSATGANAVAIGNGASAATSQSYALGFGATAATNSGAMALGNSYASGTDSFAAAITSNSSSYGALGANSIAIGPYAKASFIGATAIGRSPVATATNAVAIGKSYTSGGDSFAAAIANNTSSYGATGTNSVAIGYQTKATNLGAVAIGYNAQATAVTAVAIGQAAVASSRAGVAINEGATASADSAVCLGEDSTTSGANGSIIGGYLNTASGLRSAILGGYSNAATVDYSIAMGSQAKSDKYGKIAHATGAFATTGDAQGAIYVLRADTTDATATVLTTNNATAASTNQIVAASDTCIMFSGTIVAMQNGAQDQGGWEIKGLLKNDGGTTTLVSSNIQTFAEGNGWAVALSADNTNNALAITCTGEAAHNIRWVANIQTSEVTYA